MQNTDDIFESLGGIFFKNLIDSTNEKNSAAQTRLILAGIALLTFVGAEAVKILFRNNFGSKGINLLRAFLCLVGFGLISAGCIAAWFQSDSPDLEQIGSPKSFLLAGIFYAILGIYVFAKAIVQKARAKDLVHPQYRGDSYLLSFLMKSGWSQAKVQNLAEPLLTLAIGIFPTPVNLLWGIPLLFCALSVWLHQLFELIFGVSHVRDVLAERGYQISRENGFSEVKH